MLAGQWGEDTVVGAARSLGLPTASVPHPRRASVTFMSHLGVWRQLHSVLPSRNLGEFPACDALRGCRDAQAAQGEAYDEHRVRELGGAGLYPFDFMFFPAD